MAKKARQYCRVFSCLNSDRTKNVTFYTLPKEDARRRQWLLAINKEDLQKDPDDVKFRYYYVCSAHFKESDFKSGKNLDPDAVPCLLLGNSMSLTDSTTQTGMISDPNIDSGCIKMEIEEEPAQTEMISDPNINSQCIKMEIEEEPLLSEHEKNMNKPLDDISVQSDMLYGLLTKPYIKPTLTIEKEAQMYCKMSQNITSKENNLILNDTQKNLGISDGKATESTSHCMIVSKDVLHNIVKTENTAASREPESHTYCKILKTESVATNPYLEIIIPPNVSQCRNNSFTSTQYSDTHTQTTKPLRANPSLQIIISSKDSQVRNNSSTQYSDKQTQTTKQLRANTPMKRKLSDELKESKKECRELKFQMKKMQKQLDEAETSHQPSMDSEDEVGVRFMKLLEAQKKIKSHFKGNRYNFEYKFFALNLRYASPEAYLCLQKVLKLPCKATLSRFRINIRSNLDKTALESLKFKMKSLSDNAKYCTILVNKTPLKKNLYYDINSDEIIGVCNINGKISAEFAHTAYVLTLQGIDDNWSQPLAYAFLADGEYYDELDAWCNDIISKLSRIGFKVKAIISPHMIYFSQLFQQKKGVTVDKPYFVHNDLKIYYISDVPHLMESLRNHLLSGDFCYGSEGKISFEYIKELYDDQKEKNLRLMPKITEFHMNPNKNDIKHALQLFSRSTSAALHTYIDFGRISEDARLTANFIEAMNDMFDVLNSSTQQTENKYQIAFTNSKDQECILDRALCMFTTIDQSTTENINTFTDFQISIKAIKMLFEDLKNDGLKCLFTRRLNVDTSNKVFQSIRLHTQSGLSAKPTPIQFQKAFSKVFICNTMKSPQENTFDICDIMLQAEDIINFKLATGPEVRKPSKVSLDGDSDYQIELPEKNALSYVSRFLLYKCLHKHTCNVTEYFLKSIPDLNLSDFSIFNEKIALHSDSQEITNFAFITHVLDMAFIKNFETAIKKNPGDQLYTALFVAVTEHQIFCPCFPIDYLLKLFIRLRIYATLKSNTNILKNVRNKSVTCIKLGPL